jgi:hypothetical protein
MVKLMLLGWAKSTAFSAPHWVLASVNARARFSNLSFSHFSAGIKKLLQFINSGKHLPQSPFTGQYF